MTSLYYSKIPTSTTTTTPTTTTTTPSTTSPPTPMYTYNLTPYPCVGTDSHVIEVKQFKTFGGAKKVAYFEKVVVYEHIHKDDLTSSEHDAYWFQDFEYAITRLECKETLDLMEKGKSISSIEREQEQQSLLDESCRSSSLSDSSANDDNNNNNVLCCRGLESTTKAGKRQTYKFRSDAIAAIQSEQDRQWSDIYRTCLDEEKLAEAYRMVTATASTLARQKGMDDEEYVRQQFCCWFPKQRRNPTTTTTTTNTTSSNKMTSSTSSSAKNFKKSSTSFWGFTYTSTSAASTAARE